LVDQEEEEEADVDGQPAQQGRGLQPRGDEQEGEDHQRLVERRWVRELREHELGPRSVLIRKIAEFSQISIQRQNAACPLRRVSRRNGCEELRELYEEVATLPE
jgi:hypothetical protein